MACKRLLCLHYLIAAVLDQCLQQPRSQAVDTSMAFRDRYRVHFYFCLCRIVAGLITGFGLDFLGGILAGPSLDRATLQLVGT
eukprot:2428369-Amphidinium_carterae.1